MLLGNHPLPHRRNKRTVCKGIVEPKQLMIDANIIGNLFQIVLFVDYDNDIIATSIGISRNRKTIGYLHGHTATFRFGK